MNTHKPLASLTLVEQQLTLSKQTIHDSLTVLIHAHHAIKVTINQIKHLRLITDQKIMSILQEEIKLIEDEITHLDFLLKSEQT